MPRCRLVNTECRRAGIGCFDCKKRVAEAIIRRIEPVREKIEAYLARPADLQEVLRDGSARARAVAAETMAEVRSGHEDAQPSRNRRGTDSCVPILSW